MIPPKLKYTHTYPRKDTVRHLRPKNYTRPFIISTNFSDIAAIAATGCPDTCVGKTEASITRSPEIPCTLRFASTTESSGEVPIRHVPTYGKESISLLVSQEGAGEEKGAHGMTGRSTVLAYERPEFVVCDLFMRKHVSYYSIRDPPLRESRSI